MDIQEFILQIVEVGVIEVEASFQRTVGDTSLTFEQFECLGEDFIEGHCHPSSMPMRRAEDSVGIGKAIRAYVYRTELPKESRKSWERVTQRWRRSHRREGDVS